MGAGRLLSKKVKINRYMRERERERESMRERERARGRERDVGEIEWARGERESDIEWVMG